MKRTPPATPAGPCPRCGGSGFAVDEDGVARPCDCGVAEARALERRRREAALPPRFADKTLAGFKTPSAEYRNILTTAKAYAEGFGPETRDGMILRGGTGSGKTHLAVAILNRVLERGHTGVFCNFPELLQRLRDSFDGDGALTQGELLEPVLGRDLMVIDDLGAETPSNWVLEKLYLIVNKRYELMRPIIVTTNQTEAELQKRLGPRTMSRLYEMCGMEFPPFPQQDWRVARMR